MSAVPEQQPDNDPNDYSSLRHVANMLARLAEDKKDLQKRIRMDFMGRWRDPLYVELIFSFAANILAGECVRKHRLHRAPLHLVEEDEEDTGPDPRYTPIPRTPEEQEAFMRGQGERVFHSFDFLMSDGTSIWKAPKEKIIAQLKGARKDGFGDGSGGRVKHIVGACANADFLRRVAKSLRNGQTPEEAGLNDEDMERLSKLSKEWAKEEVLPLLSMD